MEEEREIPDYVVGQIYLITNTVNEKQYVGQTKTHMFCGKKNTFVPYGYQKRFKSHLSNSHNYEKYGRCYALNQAMAKYGTDKFQTQLLEECPIYMLDDLETLYISEFGTLSPNGYNLTTGGNAGKWTSEETRERQSESKKKFYQTEAGEQRKQEYGAFISDFNSKNNQAKKLEKFKDVEMERILVSYSKSENKVYVNMYRKGSSKREKSRFAVLGEESFNMIRDFIRSITSPTTKVEYSEEAKTLANW